MLPVFSNHEPYKWIGTNTKGIRYVMTIIPNDVISIKNCIMYEKLNASHTMFITCLSVYKEIDIKINTVHRSIGAHLDTGTIY